MARVRRQGLIKTERREVIKDHAIVEMRCTRATGRWVPMRLRRDKTEPNAYRVALDNWRNIFHPVASPDRWAPGAKNPTTRRCSTRTTPTPRRRPSAASSTRVLLKRCLILKATRVWGAGQSRASLKAYDMGCGKGIDLERRASKYARFGSTWVDYDRTHLVRQGRVQYLLGGRQGPPRGNGHSAPWSSTRSRGTALTLFAQATESRALVTCKDGAEQQRPGDAADGPQVPLPGAEPRALQDARRGARLAQVLDGRTTS